MLQLYRKLGAIFSDVSPIMRVFCFGFSLKSENHFSDSSQTKHLQFPIGSIKQLHCRLTPPSVKRVIWERKPCKEEYFNRRKCKDDGNWTLLAETSRKLTLGKTNESLNGLYRCKHNNKVVREFYVEIAGEKIVKVT